MVTQGALINIMIIFIVFFKMIYSKEVPVFVTKGQISFAEIKDYIINLGEKKKELLETKDFKSFLSIHVNVTLSNECIKNSNVLFNIFNILLELWSTITDIW